MNRLNDPRSLMQSLAGGPSEETKKDKEAPRKNSDVLKALIPGQLGRKSLNKATAGLQDVVKGLKK